MVEIDRAFELEESHPVRIFTEVQVRAILSPPDNRTKDGTLVPGFRHKNGRHCWGRRIDGGYQFVGYVDNAQLRLLHDALEHVKLGEPTSDGHFTYYPSWTMKSPAKAV